MKPIRRLLLVVLCLTAFDAIAAEPDFSGSWAIDLRTPKERQRKAECGSASFNLKQEGTKITGNHTMSPTGCGRINEGGEGTVRGVVVGLTAVLVVTSGRNGAIVLGTATLKNNRLYWQTNDEVRPGNPPTDSPLILAKGVLSRAKYQH